MNQPSILMASFPEIPKELNPKFLHIEDEWIGGYYEGDTWVCILFDSEWKPKYYGIARRNVADKPNGKIARRVAARRALAVQRLHSEDRFDTEWYGEFIPGHPLSSVAYYAADIVVPGCHGEDGLD